MPPDPDLVPIALADLVLAHAAGELSGDELAAAVRELSAEDLDLEEARAGLVKKTITDKSGKQTHVWVKSTQTSGAQQHRKEKRAALDQPPAPAEPTKRGVLHGAVVGAVRAALAGGSAIKAGFERLTGPEQKALKVLGGALKELYHQVEAPRHFFEQMAVEVARERGLSETHVRTVGTVLAVAKVVEQWGTGIPIAHHILGELDIHGLTGFLAAKVGALIPVTAMAYVGWSAAASVASGNPLALYRAARKVLSGTSHTHHEAVAGEDDSRDLAGRLLEALERADGSPWYLALLYAGMEDGEGLGTAIDRADRAFADNPEPPEEESEDGTEE